MSPAVDNDFSKLGIGDESTVGVPRSGGRRSLRFHAVIERVMWVFAAVATLNIAVAIASLVMTSNSPFYVALGSVVETANPLVVGLGCAVIATVAMFVVKRPLRRVEAAILLTLSLGVIPLVVVCVFGVLITIHGAV